MHNRKELIILKISGASLKGEKDIINIEFLNEIARQIKELSSFYKVAVVLGGGNIWRGAIANQIGMQRYKADQMGMLATVMNSLALQSALTNIDVNSKIFSTIEMEKIVDSYIIRNLEFALDNNYVAILSCGTGRPYFTTDTGIAVSAAELGATYIMMGKNSVDGVYDSDPNVNKDAKFFEHLTYTKAIEDQLEVMDITAASILKQCNVKTIVFKINEYNAIINTLNKKSKFTLVSEHPNDLNTLKFSFKNYKKNNESNSSSKNLNFNDKNLLEFYLSELNKLNENVINKNEKKLKEIKEIFNTEKNK
ncbi:MAG: UMP kinase [Malacoplasma sp.]|nr:UMP kinase [Malacoplasma sp.]MDE7099894.1 UMP kinase [Malacoplasma sp.]